MELIKYSSDQNFQACSNDQEVTKYLIYEAVNVCHNNPHRASVNGAELNL
jgi:hypothetical protein